MNVKIRMAALAVAATLSGTAQAALYDRGGGLIYDSDLNVTWLKDANYAKTSGFDADGAMNWTTATTWAANLSYFDTVRNVTYTDWRLPTSNTCSGYNCIGSEMGHLFYNELGGTAGQSILTSPDPDLAKFTNLQSSIYWSGTGFALNQSYAWRFSTGSGSQDFDFKFYGSYALAVRPGDIANLLPVALISGPYAITQGQNLLLDGIASYDPDYVADSIAQYAWDLNGDATFDVFGATADVDAATLTGLGLGAGTHTIALRVTDTHGTFADSTTSLTIAAIPEPQTYAMMLAGLGLVGWAAKRRTPALV